MNNSPPVPVSATAYLCIGSNLGNRPAMLMQAVKLLSGSVGQVQRASRVYESEPWGSSSTNRFLNQVIQLETRLTPELLLREIQNIETYMGRVRTNDRNSDRSVDIDILFYNDLAVKYPHLEIPHPRLQDRRFVLAPLSEIAPHLRDPRSGFTINELLRSCADSLEVSPFIPTR